MESVAYRIRKQSYTDVVSINVLHNGEIVAAFLSKSLEALYYVKDILAKSNNFEFLIFPKITENKKRICAIRIFFSFVAEYIIQVYNFDALSLSQRITLTI